MHWKAYLLLSLSTVALTSISHSHNTNITATFKHYISVQYIGRDDLCRDASARLALGSAGFGRVHSSAVTATALCSTRIHASESNRNARTHGTAGLMQVSLEELYYSILVVFCFM